MNPELVYQQNQKYKLATAKKRYPFWFALTEIKADGLNMSTWIFLAIGNSVNKTRFIFSHTPTNAAS